MWNSSLFWKIRNSPIPKNRDKSIAIILFKNRPYLDNCFFIRIKKVRIIRISIMKRTLADWLPIRCSIVNSNVKSNFDTHLNVLRNRIQNNLLCVWKWNGSSQLSLLIFHSDVLFFSTKYFWKHKTCFSVKLVAPVCSMVPNFKSKRRIWILAS